MTLSDQVATTLRRRIRLPRGARVLVAVSGGADSVALAWLLADLAERGVIVLAGVGHLNHQLRGAEADADEAFVAALAVRLRVPCKSARVDVAALAAARGESIEAAARRARYAWLAEAAEALGATHIATGHTLDDQAETVLLRLLRGAGTRGLSGIRATRGAVIRPLLDSRREDVRAYLSARGEAFREDASNQDTSIPRNRIRHELLPVINRLAPGGLAALARTARLAADDEAVLQSRATVAAGFVVSHDADGVRLRRGLLVALPPAIGRRVIRGGIERVVPLEAPRLTSGHIESVWRSVLDGGRRRIDLPGVRVDVAPDAVWLRGVAGERQSGDGCPEFAYPLEVPGVLTVPEAGWSISAERRDQNAAEGVELCVGPRAALRIVVPASLVGDAVTVRNRRPGDRIKPIGGSGRKKVQDLLVDQKVPRDKRDRVPVVVGADGRVVWVVGVAMADEFRVTAPQSEVVVFTAERQ